MAASRPDQDRVVQTGERPIKPENSKKQLVSHKDERIVSRNPSPDAAIMGSTKDVSEQPESANSGDHSFIHSLNAYGSQELNMSYGYGNNTTTWDGYSQYVNADGLHVSPVMYNDNTSHMFHSGYGFNPEMVYGQYSPVATLLPSLLVEGQLYPPQQIPFCPTYYPQPGPPSLPSALPVSPTEMMTPESSSDSLLFGQTSGYFVNFGSYGGNVSGNPGSSPLTSPAAYPQPMGILGSYEQNVGQIPQQQRMFNAFGLASSSSPGCYPHGANYQCPYFGSNDRVRLAADKGRRGERDQDSISISNESLAIDRNRGPRASKIKGKTTESLSSSNSKNNSSGSGIHFGLYNRVNFATNYENAKFFIIKSFSEDNVHKSIKYNVWASTPHGNKKLDAAYREAKDTNASCPVFLLFSVNASGQFCGVAEMIGHVDFENNADYWQQDRWSGQFPVKWHIIKDVPNSRFRHLILENNDNKPVTHSRDSQEVKLEQGVEMLRIFKDHDARTSMLDDFDFYDERERSLKEKTRQQASQNKCAADLLADDSINIISDSLAQKLQWQDRVKETRASNIGAVSSTDVSGSLTHDSMDVISNSFIESVPSEYNSNKEVATTETGSKN